jgi:hypothetical protein
MIPGMEQISERGLNHPGSGVRTPGSRHAARELISRPVPVAGRLRRLAVLLVSGKWAYVAGVMLPVSQVITVEAPVASNVGDSTESSPR